MNYIIRLFVIGLTIGFYFLFEGISKKTQAVAIKTGNEISAPIRRSVSWLPGEDYKNVPLKESPTSKYEIDLFLETLQGSIRPLICSYDGSVLTAHHPFTNEKLRTGKNKWSYSINAEKVAGDPDALDITVTVRLEKGRAFNSGMAVAFDFENWSSENYLLFPAAVYNGNRNRIVYREYATGMDRADLYRQDMPLTTTELPQLSPVPGEVSRIELNSSNVTTPAVCFYNRKTQRAFIMLAEQGMESGDTILDNVFIAEENPDRSFLTIAISSPGVREWKPEFVGFSKSQDRGINWISGDTVSLRLRIYNFEAENIPGLLDRFATVRKSVTGKNNPRNLMPFSYISELMNKNINERFYEGRDFRFYRPENADWISFGWIGGLMNTFPMLALNDDFHFERVESTFDFAIPRAQGASGYFYGAINYDGNVFGREGYDEFPELTLTRKSADVLMWMMKQFYLLEAQGRGNRIKSSWEKNIKKLADAFVDTWNRYGQWGNVLNNKTGGIAVFNTTSGASAISGLTLASIWFNQPQYLHTAMEAATCYYKEFYETGMTTGCCADILQNADHETAIALMTSIMSLYESTSDHKWLRKATDLANLCATWIVSHDYRMPPETELGQLDARLAGAVWASTQNKHSAPGFCTSSGDALFKIYRATGDIRYAGLLKDVIHAWSEGVQPNGGITERLGYCDAGSRGSRLPGGKTGWTETNGALMSLEIPGIYLRTDAEEFFVFDQVNARVVSRTDDGVIIEIHNTTPMPAEITIFAENYNESRVAMPVIAFINWPKITVNPGMRKKLLVVKDDNRILNVEL